MDIYIYIFYLQFNKFGYVYFLLSCWLKMINLRILQATANPKTEAVCCAQRPACGTLGSWQGLIIPQRAGHASVAIFGAVGVLVGLASLSMVALQHPDVKDRTGPKFSRVFFPGLTA